MGEPAGIGPEITLKAWKKFSQRTSITFFVIGDPIVLRNTLKTLNFTLPIEEIKKPTDANLLNNDTLPIIPVKLSKQPQPGHPIVSNNEAVIESVRRAVEYCKLGEVSGIVTNPFHKASLYSGGFKFKGHTEFLQALCDSPTAPVMMLSCPELRTVPVTVHLSLLDAIARLSPELILSTIEVTAKAMIRDFGIANPRIAVSGLNPHASEGGYLGTEEKSLLNPVVTKLRKTGLNIKGPLPPDSMFSPQVRQSYDVAVCMLHDQALIPIKTIHFDSAVNITLGLPIVRTSPDHGTALDIAGHGTANPASLISAISHAKEIAKRRLANK